MHRSKTKSNLLNSFVIYILASILILASLSLFASDKEKEQRWAEQITDSLLDGEAITLKAGNDEFSAIFTESTAANNERAVILLHGMGAHPDWPEVIHPLRVGLPEHHWSTLSIQLPVLGNEATITDYGLLFKEAGPRIQAATEYLRSLGSKTIVLVSHSLGAAMATHYLATTRNEQIKGIVAIGISDIKIDPDVDIVKSIATIHQPYLDLYGSRDLDAVSRSASARKKASLKAGNKHYQQKKVAGADHFFLGHNTTLVRLVYGWLKRHHGPKKH